MMKLGVLIPGAWLFTHMNVSALPQEPVDLGTAGGFAVLAGAGITDTSGTTVDGNVGASPITGAAIGLTAGQVNGTIYTVDNAGPLGSVMNPGLLTTAKNDLTTAYNDAAGRILPTLIPSGELGGLTLFPGLYKHDAALASLGLTGTLTLDAQGDPNAVWIFQSDLTLITEVDSMVVLINGAESCLVFWQVGSSATLKTRSIFKGIIMADQSIVLQSGVSLEGQALARIAGITLDGNTVGIPPCVSTMLYVPADIEIECDEDIPVAPQVILDEVCSTQSTIAVLSETIVPGVCENAYTIQRIWSATNECGELISATQMITVVDSTPPDITCPDPVTVACESDIPPPDISAVSASDNCGPVVITHEGDTSLTDACGGTITRTYRATDECGLFAECTQLITVSDDTAPEITCPLSPIVVLGDTNCVAVVPDLRPFVEVTDNCSTNGITVTQSPPAGTLFTIQTNVILTATDICGNPDECIVLLTTPCEQGVTPFFSVEKLMTNVYTEAGSTNQRPAMIGEAINFVITIVNTGEVTLGIIPVVDTYNPLQLQYVSATPPSVDNVNDGVINWTDVGPLAPGATRTIVVNFIAICSIANQPGGTNVVLVSPGTINGAEPILPLLATAPFEIMAGSLEGNVWIDLNGNGIPDENLAVQGINGVTVRLLEILPGATNLVDEAVTATMNGERGAYLFEGHPNGNYRVVVDITTLPPTLMVNTTPVQVNVPASECGLFADVNFGFVPANPTVVDLVEFQAVADGNRVTISWETLTEWNNAGYNLYRATDPSGSRIRINTELIPGSADGSGRHYVHQDPSPLEEGVYYYWLEDIEYDNSARIHGPVRVQVGTLLPDARLIGTARIAKAGLYVITTGTLRRSGIHPASIDPARLRIYIDQMEVAAYVTTDHSTFAEWDYVLLYAESGGLLSIGHADGTPPRMNYRFVFLNDAAGDVWSGHVENNEDGIRFQLLQACARYLITGFNESLIWMLDITRPEWPSLLLGADVVQVGSETGLYFSDGDSGTGTIFATGNSTVIEIESILAK